MSIPVQERFSYADLHLPRSLGVFGLMSCPGARAGRPGSADSFDSLSRDFSEICSNRVRMVISCLEPSELPVEPEYYYMLYKRERIQWEMVPIPDYHPPSRSHDRVLAQLFDTVDLRLRLGEKVGFHCYGGLGRTGTVVARYLIHKGLMPEEAILYIRKNYDSQAIESVAQEKYLQLCRPLPSAALPENLKDTVSRPERSTS